MLKTSTPKQDPLEEQPKNVLFLYILLIEILLIILINI